MYIYIYTCVYIYIHIMDIIYDCHMISWLNMAEVSTKLTTLVVFRHGPLPSVSAGASFTSSSNSTWPSDRTRVATHFLIQIT